MPFDLNELWSSLSNACRLSSDNDSMAALTHEGSRTQLSPWTFWTLICLVRHHPRQQWVGEIVKHRLSGEPSALASGGALAHPSTEQQGLVPGNTDWEYYFHGKGCCLTNRITGESIDVDFFDETADWIDDFFYCNYLRSLRTPEAPEARLLCLHPSRQTILIAIDELLAMGCLVRIKEGKVFKLADDVLAQAELIESYCERWRDEKARPTMAACVGDWLVAEETASALDEEVAQRLQQLAKRCREGRFGQLDARFQSGDFHAKQLSLLAMAELPTPRLADYIRAAVTGKIDGLTSTAITFVCDGNDPAWRDDVWQLLSRIDPAGEIPHAYVGVRCAQYLFKQGHRSELVARKLSQFTNRGSAEAAILALEYAPEYSLSLFRHALRSTVPMERTEGAAALAILDLPWCHTVLGEVLAESTDQAATSECRAALQASRDWDAQQLAANWEMSNPQKPAKGPYITFEEMSLRNRHEWLQHQMEKWHDRVLPLRDRQPPPEPLKRRWRWLPW
jgi:hypothetical protein